MNMIGKDFTRADHRLPFELGRLDVIDLGDFRVTRTIMQPGWSWAQCIKPLVETESCDVLHVGYILRGRLRFKLDDDGSEAEFGPEEAYFVPAGHDSWVVGDEPCVTLNFQGGPSPSRSLELSELQERMRRAQHSE